MILFKKKHSNIFTTLCYSLIALVIILLFTENFVFSSELGLLNFREVDDVAFQTTLRRAHLLIDNGRFNKLLRLNDYAYGWVYWFPLSILTYPLYLLSEHFSIDWPLIVFPRQVSLFFAVLSLIYLRKILKLLDADEWVIAATLLIFSLFPTFGYFSMRFGTVNPVLFFSLLSFYLALKDTPSTKNGRFRIVLALSIAGGIKLSGLLIAPIIFLMVFLRLPEKNFKKMTRLTVLNAFVFLCLLILFTNPALFAAPFKPYIAKEYLGILHHILNGLKSSSDALTPVERLYYGIAGTKIQFFVGLTLITGIFLLCIKEKKIRYDAFVAFIGILIAIAYLIISVKHAVYTGLYFTALSFLFLIGTIGWGKSRAGFPALVILIGLMFLDQGNRVGLKLEGSYNFNHLNYFIESKNAKTATESANYIMKCVEATDPKTWKKRILVDYRIPTKFNYLSYPNACTTFIYDDLSSDKTYCDGPVDFIVLDSKARNTIPEEDFKKQLDGAADAKSIEVMEQDRGGRVALSTTGLLNKQKYKLICNYDKIRVYKKSDNMH